MSDLLNFGVELLVVMWILYHQTFDVQSILDYLCYFRDEAFQDRLSKFTANKSQFLYSSTKDPTGDHAGHEDNG